MKIAAMTQVRRLIFGHDCARELVTDLAARGTRHVFLVSAPAIQTHIAAMAGALREQGLKVSVSNNIESEPTIGLLRQILADAREAKPDTVVGLGGGSVLDVAKLVAALLSAPQDVEQVLGINQLTERRIHLACLPTTAGTGSEVSPNSLLLNEQTQQKQAAISPFLVPDAAYIDPKLTVSVPPAVTAATGIDALTHCIEAYANVNAHPMIDLYALEGVRLIGAFLERAVRQGGDLEAREAVALGSLYGGLCLGPVNTGGVHALAYPLGGEFHIAHGLSNALLLPHVLRFNIPAAPQRYANLARALGEAAGANDEETSRRGVERIEQLIQQCGLASTLSELGIPVDARERMVTSAMGVTRLLKNNPREITAADADAIYRAAY